MIKLLVEKELKGILLSPKFVATFAACSLLILLSIFVGIMDYHAIVRQYEAANRLTEQEMQETASWMALNTRAFRKPDPMQVFIAGVNNDIGRLSAINQFTNVKLTNSIYSDDPIYAVFRFIDFTYIVMIVLSLFAILFTYDAINGERETGTLKLIFSKAVPRIQYILAKCVGSWLGLVLPLLIPIMLGFLLVLVFRVPLTGDHWARIFVLLGFSVLYFTFFIVLGLLVSALTRHSAVSFLILLVAWITFVLIIPRTGVMIAGQMMPVASAAETDGQIDGYARARWTKYTEAIANRWRSRNAEMEGLSASEREAYRDEHLWQWLEQEDTERNAVQVDINDFSRKLRDDLRIRKAVQERLAFTLSRLSPASAFMLAAMNLAGTDIALKTRYEDAMQHYRSTFDEFREKKQKESGTSGGIRISFDTDTGFNINTGADVTLDLGTMPRFEPPQHTLAAGLLPAITDFGLLFIYTIVALAGAFVAFLRYDVR